MEKDNRNIFQKLKDAYKEANKIIEEKRKEIDKEDIVYDELEDYQKKEVKNNNYDSYNFEEDELEEDDYYNEDDE